MLAAEQGQFIFIERSEVVLVDLYAARDETVQATDEIEKCRLTGPGGAEETDELAPLDIEPDPA